MLARMARNPVAASTSADPHVAAVRNGESLRERKKRATRRLLSDTATEMFLANGFEGVRVSEIAEACGVSEKTVFNYFPTKESLLMDRLGDTSDAFLAALADPTVPPLRAALDVLADELAALAAQLAAQPDFRQGADRFQRFGTLLRSTPSLRAHQHAVTEQLSTQAASILAERDGLDPADPQPQITAAAVLALWPIQFRSLQRHLEAATSAEELTQAVIQDLQHAAAILEHGLLR